MHIHLIAIGGAVMHNLAITLHKKGFYVTGSDDEIFEPSAGRLKKYGLLPPEPGWFPEKITNKTNTVILGMHAKKDNPELLKAKQLGIDIKSFPEFLFEQTKQKKRVVIAGSHGKTTITSMVLHALKTQNIPFDYMVGSQLPGFETMVGFNDQSKIAVFEGDEYLSSPLDPQSKFLHYKPYLSLISGISWDHINVFPVYQDYKNQFKKLCNITNPEGKIFFCNSDKELSELVENTPFKAPAFPYEALLYKSTPSGCEVHFENKTYPTHLIGRYNMENLSGAMNICRELGIPAHRFLNSMKSFSGATRRQEKIYSTPELCVYHDFAHAPSKVKATVAGFRENFPDKKLIVILELHTFSSLNKSFLPHYKHSLTQADEACVFFNPRVVKNKNLPEIKPEDIRRNFDYEKLHVLREKQNLMKLLYEKKKEINAVLVLMTSGNMGEINLKEIFNFSPGKK